MKLLINATALDSRGGFSIINAFLSEMHANNLFLEKHNIQIIVLVSRNELCKFETNELQITYNASPKQGFWKKWYFESKYLPKMMEHESIDAYLSLQNFGISRLKVPQYVLIHQPIPFAQLNINELELKNYLKYKLLLNLIYKLQLKKINGVFVQTNWMKEALVRKYKYNIKKIKVVRPNVEDISNNNGILEPKISREFQRNEEKFVYITNSEKYKNNHFLVNVINQYNEENEKKIVLYLTTEGESTTYIRYIGKIPYSSIFTLYQNVDALIFPSLTETLGLPLLEAMQSDKAILASDLPYAKEICVDNAVYFDPRKSASLIEAIKSYTLNKKERNEKDELPQIENGVYLDYIKYICADIRLAATN